MDGTNTTYSYLFSSTKPIRTSLSSTAGEPGLYSLNLTTYELTDEQELAVLAGKIIDRVSFINEEETSNPCSASLWSWAPAIIWN